MKTFILYTILLFVLISTDVPKYNLSEKNESSTVQDSIRKIKDEDAGIINIVIDSLDDNDLLKSNVWGDEGYSFSNKYFQEGIINEFKNLATQKNYNFKFYTEAEANRNHVQPNIIINLKLVNLDKPYIHLRNSSKSSMQQNFAENTVYPKDQFTNVGLTPPGNNSADTYYTYTTVIGNESDYSIYIKGSFELNIKNVTTGKISSKKISGTYEWSQETHPKYIFYKDGKEEYNKTSLPAEYSKPRLTEILYKLYSKIYPQVKNEIDVTLN